jgi:hypothetical protein
MPLTHLFGTCFLRFTSNHIYQRRSVAPFVGVFYRYLLFPPMYDLKAARTCSHAKAILIKAELLSRWRPQLLELTLDRQSS